MLREIGEASEAALREASAPGEKRNNKGLSNEAAVSALGQL